MSSHAARAGAALALVTALAAGGAVAADDPAELARGKALFASAVPPCGLCHALKDAGATGAVGPSLDDLRPDAERVANVLRTGVGAMPPYKATLNEAQMRALARYVARASGGAR